jgi:hypothetical protein
MLEIGSFQARLCQGIGRRAFLRAGLAAPWLLGLPKASAAQSEYGARRVQSVLVLWLWGAPSHVDTFDPKPGAPAEYRGPFGTIPTRTPGVRFTELLPRLAARSDRFSLIRSNKNFHGGHLEAGMMGMTGARELAQQGMPNFGSIIARHRGGGALPPFIALGRGMPRDVAGVMKGYGGGQWGATYDPFLVQCSEQGQVDIPSLRLFDGLTPERLGERRRLLGELDQLQRHAEQAQLEQWDSNYGRGYALLASPEARRALDLSLEPPATRSAYGQTSFGQSCLLARRLLEARVPYIQVNWSQYVECMMPNADFGWDTHVCNFELLADRHCPILDRVLSALLDDLGQRGLLQTTLVVCMGEFGRTPRISGQAARDHWPNVYFSIWAGGGVQPGRVIGESDRLGGEPITEAITPVMVGTTIADLAGVTSAARAQLGVLSGGRVIHELF